MPFQTLSTITGTIFAALCVTLLFMPDLIFWLFGLEGNALGYLMGKRAAMLFLGLSLMCLMARNTASDEVMRLVALTVGGSMGAMAVLGLFELARGVMGPGVLLAVAVELAFVVLFWRIWRASSTG